MLDEDYNFFKEENLNTDSDSISILKEDGSTYMGVKTIQEGTVADTNKKELKKNSPKKNKSKKTKKKSSSSSNSSFSSNSSSSEQISDDIKENLLIEKNEPEDDKLKQEEIIDLNKNKENNSNLIKTEFTWDEGGNIVYITGSFCEWKDHILMKKNQEGIFSTSLMLPPGFYQYKFIIDNNWQFSKKHPKFEDSNGNVNNFIDTTNYENSPQIKIEEKKELKRNSSINSIGLLNNSNYATYIPLKGELSSKPLALPGLYKTHYILNEKKNKKIKERKFSQIEYVDHSNKTIHNLENSKYFVNNNQYVGFQHLYHIHSNHLHSKENSDSKNTITSIITRYRTKYSTFIYYKEKNQRERSKQRHSKTVKENNNGLNGKIGKIVKRKKNTVYK